VEATAWRGTRFSGCPPAIATMQATDAGTPHHSGRVGLPPFDNTPRGRLFVQSIMNAIFVTVLKVLSNQPPHVGLAQHDHVLKQVSATASDPALRHAVLPRTVVGRSNQLAAEAFPHPRDVSVELAITVEDQVLGCGLLWEDFS
jgi:hypothetical protein